jgi:hypothetical protein
VGFEPPPEFQGRGGVGHALVGQLHAREPAQRLTVIEGVFEGFVGQAIPWLEEIHPPAPLQPDGRACPFALRIERRKDRQQPRPREEGCPAREELLAAGDFLLRGKFGLGETRLVGQALKVSNPGSNRPY